MTSVFGQKNHERRLDLTAQLIMKLLNVKPDDANYELALDFCLQKEYYHSFIDVNPTAVESFYLSVIKRLHEDSQLSKASALSALTTKLLSYNFSSVTADLNHSLLQLLASLVGQPLNSVLDETPQLLSAVYQSAEDDTQQAVHQQRVLLQRFQQLAAGSSKSAVSLGYGSDSSGCASTAQSDYDPYSEGSDLTSWDSDAEEDSSRAWQLPSPGTAPSAEVEAADLQLEHAATAPAAAAVDNGKGMPVRTAACYLPATALQGPHELQPGLTRPHPAALLARLATSQVEQLPLTLPDPDYCFTEPYLVQQLLQLLQGHQAHGFITSAESTPPWYEAGAAAGCLKHSCCSGILQQRFVPNPLVTSPAQSPTALHALLNDFAAAGSAALQLRRLSQQLCQSRGAAWISADVTAHLISAVGAVDRGALTDGGPRVTPCLRALGVALQHQLDMLGQYLSQLHQDGPFCTSAAAAPAAAVAAGTRPARQQQEWSLLMVKQQTAAIRHRLLLLHKSVFGVLQQLGGSQAAVSAALLEGLYQQASTAATGLSGLQGMADAAALLHLLLCSCVPLVAAVQQWLWSAADDRAAASCDGSWTAHTHQTRQHSTVKSQQHQLSVDPGVSVCSGDFFITRKSDVAATDASFWHEAYEFRRSPCLPAASSTGSATDSRSQHAEVTEGLIACPSFMLPLASNILTAGKSVRLLEYMEQEEFRQTLWIKAKPQAPTSSAAAVVHQPNSSNMRVALRASSNKFSRPFKPNGSKGGSSTRRRWGDAAPTAPAGIAVHSAAAAPNLARQVKLQLAMAAEVAGQQGEQQLAFDFVDTANSILRSSQQTSQQHKLQPGNAVSADTAAQQQFSTATPAEVMSRTLQAAGALLAQPCSRFGALTCGKAAGLHPQEVPPGLRQALLQANARRTAKPAETDEAAALQHKQEAGQQAGDDDTASQDQQQQDVHQHSDPHGGTDCTAGDAGGGRMQQTADAASCAGPAGQHNTAAVIVGVPRLLQRQQQLETKLLAVGSWLQYLAPWQQQPDSTKGTEPAGGSRVCAAADFTLGSFGMLSCSRVPGSFSGSLAGLWPLKPSAAACRGLLQQRPQQQLSDELQHEGGDVLWRAGGAWPCEQLSWLLITPPQQVMPLSQLLDKALLQPIQARAEAVGRQLLSSLMGEWGLLQQLQGLVGVFLLASPAVVEWTERCFATVEAAKPSMKATSVNSSDASDSLRTPEGSGAAAAAAAAHGMTSSAGHLVVGVDDLDVVELELLMQLPQQQQQCVRWQLEPLCLCRALAQQELSAFSDLDDPLPDPSCLHLSINTAALAEMRAARQQQQRKEKIQQCQQQSTDDIVTIRAGAAATGGLWCCSAEWAGLSCWHSGTWQLSLVYNSAELSRFSLAWRFLLQLRWVMHRLDGARQAARKGAASVRNTADQDAAEMAAVAAAHEAAQQADSRTLVYRSGAAIQPPMLWLSIREELLLLQEMGQLMARWQQHVMDRLVKGVWGKLQQDMLDAHSLDEVRTAAAAFLRKVSNMATSRPSNSGWKAINFILMKMMDIMLDAAAAASHLTKLRQQLAQPGAKMGTTAATQKAWLDVGAARTRIRCAHAAWIEECDLFVRWLSLSSGAGDEDAEAGLAALDMNGYYLTRAKPLQTPQTAL